MTDMEDDWFGPETATFGDRVAAARDAAGMTQTQLARRLGVKKSTVVGWENDLSEPRANKLSMMAGLLNVSIVWLLTGEGEGTEPPSEGDELSGDLAGLLIELRSLRQEMRDGAERVARIEKRVRTLIEQEKQ